MTNRERLTELRYQMEKNSFILSIIEARIAVCLHAEEMGYPDSDTAIITKTSTYYVSMIRALKNKYGGTIEELAQIVFDRVYIEDWKSSGAYSRFDTDLINTWFELKQRQEALYDSFIDRQKAQEVFQDSYFQKFGTRLSIREIKETPEHKQQQEVKVSEHTESMAHTQKKEHQMEIIAKMVEGGAITPEVAFEYINKDNDFHDYDNFLRILDIWTEKGAEENE